LKTRLLGFAVLLALAVLFVPMFFSSAPPKTDAEQSMSLEIPPAPDRELQTRTLSVGPAGAPGSSASSPLVAPPTATDGPKSSTPVSSTPASSDKVASLNLVSTKPADALPEDLTNNSAKQAKPTPVTRSPSMPPAVAPRGIVTTPAPTPKQTPAVPAAPALPVGTAARGNFTVNLSAYADRGKADALVQKVRALGYPVSTTATTQAGKALTRVNAGPFETRAAAEAARLKITSAVPGAPASLSAGSSDQQGDAPVRTPSVPSAAVPATPVRAGGFAVQLGAFSNEADANSLRDRLRGAGIAGYVDSAVGSGGNKLWRVRAGPQTQRDDAQRLREQVKARIGVEGNIVTVP
jgi:DedD protein